MYNQFGEKSQSIKANLKWLGWKITLENDVFNSFNQRENLITKCNYLLLKILNNMQILKYYFYL